jgi:Lrp/AsnC family leucine-responsive transcriptional regulator
LRVKIHRTVVELDAIDRGILEGLQDNCKQSLAVLGEKVGLSAPSVVDRIHKLEEAGVILGCAAQLDARRLGRDVTAFIGVSTDRPAAIRSVGREVALIDEVLECHHVTGSHTLMLKLKTRSTQTLKGLIDRIRDLDGVTRTETMVVLSTNVERSRIALSEEADADDDPAAQHRGRRRAAG